MSTITIETSGITEVTLHLREMPAAIRRSIGAAIYGQAVRLQEILKDDVLAGGVVKMRTKRLRNSVHIETDETGGGIVAVVGTDVEYAKYLEFGTAAHEIRATNAKALAFMLGGIMVFRKKVNHPGTPALRPFAGTLEREAPTIRAALEAAVQQAVKA